MVDVPSFVICAHANVIDAARAFRFNMGSAGDAIEFLVSKELAVN